MARASNVACSLDVSKVVQEIYRPGRAVCDDTRLFKFMDASFPKFIEVHAEFLVKLVQMTPRPTVGIIKDAVAKIFPHSSDGQNLHFATMVCKSVSRIRRIGHATTSGKKLPPAMLRVLKAMGSSAPGRLQRRSLEKRISRTSDPSATQDSIMSVHPPSPPKADVVTIESDDEILVTPGASSSGGPATDSDALQSIRALYTINACMFTVAKTAEAVPTANFLEYLTPTGLVRVTTEGETQAQMSPGLAGFAVASFEGEAPKPNEMPNIALPIVEDAVRNKPAAAPKKRPAAAPNTLYSIMCYASKESFGIRKKGANQVMSIRKPGVAVDVLRTISKGACERLEVGEHVDKVKMWAQAALAAI